MKQSILDDYLYFCPNDYPGAEFGRGDSGDWPTLVN